MSYMLNISNALRRVFGQRRAWQAVEGREASDGLWQSEPGGWLLELRARRMECEKYLTALCLHSEDRDLIRLMLLVCNSPN